MGRQSKAMVLERQSELAKIMTEGRGYAWELMWYRNHYGLSEKAFQKDKTVIYQQWKLDNAKELEDRKAEIITRLNAARVRAIDMMDVKAEIQAIKLEAQLLGILNKQGDVVVEGDYVDKQVRVDLSDLTLDELKSLL